MVYHIPVTDEGRNIVLLNLYQDTPDKTNCCTQVQPLIIVSCSVYLSRYIFLRAFHLLDNFCQTRVGVIHKVWANPLPPRTIVVGLEASDNLHHPHSLQYTVNKGLIHAPYPL